MSDFMRVRKIEGKRFPVSLDTAVVQFVDKTADKTQKKKLRVDLVAAIHVGDKEYYDELNRLFKKYDAVLYELVAEEGTVPDQKSAGKRSVISAFQSSMGKSLDLDFQLAHINYHAKNMVHADLSPEEFAKRVIERGDFVQMIYRMLVLGVKKSGEKDAQKNEARMQGRLMGAMFSSNPPLSLKRFLAEEMMNQVNDADFIFGGANGSAIISDRNAAALEVLKKQIKNGKKRIAIFYGGAHSLEFAQRLEKDFHLERAETTWITAWDLTNDKSARKVSKQDKPKN
ncbi:hypothetical protein FACS189454_08150 [Planctomycetales bacterium]|nr:hypothetical protein FACS189454_08150 [Planctomycetales bacterium]